MTKNLLLWSIGAFLVPIAWERLKYYFYPRSFQRLNFWRRTTGLNIHHGHWGLLIILFTGTWHTLSEKQPWSVALFFFGLGLLADEIISSLRMPSKDRNLELRVYEKSLPSTMLLVGMIVTGMIIFYVMRGEN